MPKSSRNILILLVILALAGLVGRRMWHVRPIIMAEIDADSPLSMPVQGALDHRFQFLSAWQSAQIPTARRFDPPLGSDHAGLSYNAQKFWDMNEKRHGHHTGDDLNGIGGMDTDLGDPVFSTADGLVLCAGDFSGGWGKLVVVAHTAPDGRRLHAMYAHLDRIDVAVGDLIPRGGRVGVPRRRFFRDVLFAPPRLRCRLRPGAAGLRRLRIVRDNQGREEVRAHP